MASFKALSFFLSFLLFSVFSLASGAETENLITEATNALLDEPQAAAEALGSVAEEVVGKVAEESKKEEKKPSAMEKIKKAFRKLKFWGKKDAGVPKAEESKAEAAAPAPAPAKN